MYELISAIIGVCGVLLTAIFAARQFRKEQWHKHVTAERTEWLKSFREEVGTIFACLEMLSKGMATRKLIADAEKARHVLYTRLRSVPQKGNEYNVEIKKFLLGIDFTERYARKFYKDTGKYVAIMELINRVLEREWDKIKGEANG